MKTKIILFTERGDTVLAETDVVEEAERVLRDYHQRGCLAVVHDGARVTLPLYPPLPEMIYLLWPMAGGTGP